MIYFYNIFSEENNEMVEQEKALLNSNLDNQNKLKDIILSYIKNFVNFNSNDSNSASTLLDILESLKHSLEYCDENIAYLNNIVQSFDEIIDAIKAKSENLNSIVDEFNQKYLDFNKLVLENTNKIEACILKVSDVPEITINAVFDDSTEITFGKKNESASINTNDSSDSNSNNSVTQIEQSTNPLTTENPSVETPKVDIQNTDNISTSTPQVSNSSINEEPKETSKVEQKIENNNNNYQENTLTISETSGKVTLPYTLSEVEEIFNSNPGKYSSIDGVIHKKFTLPLSMYKSPIISRFKEAFKLMKDKEKSSLSDAVSLGFELMFRSDIHPAIITACDSLDDLDAYLDYLDSDGKMDFNCFKIIFDFKPLSVKKKKNNFEM